MPQTLNARSALRYNWSRLMVGRIALSKKFSVMIKLTEIREITPYLWVHPDEER
jgi:hypothetical protein